MSDHIDVDALRHNVHMKMLSQSKNANDCGDLTVVPLGFAVSIAVDLIASQRKEAEQMGIQMGRVASIDEYVAQCNVLRVEPSRRSIMLFQAVQQVALAELAQANTSKDGTGESVHRLTLDELPSSSPHGNSTSKEQS